MKQNLLSDWITAGTHNPEWSGSKPSTPVDPEGDGAEEGQGPRLWCLWDRL